MLSYTSFHPISLCRKNIKYIAINPIVTRVKMTRNEVAFCRTNVMADYIEKFTNDINVVAAMEDQDESNDYSCKYIAMINCIIIIVILIFMFMDRKED